MNESQETKTFYEVMRGSLEIHSLSSPRKQSLTNFINDNIEPLASRSEDGHSEFQKRFDNLEDALKDASSHEPILQRLNSGIYHFEEFYVNEVKYDLDENNEPVWDEGIESDVYTTFDCFYGFNAETTQDDLIVFQPDMESMLNACSLNHKKQENDVTGIGYQPETNKIIAVNYDKDGKNPIEDMKYVISLGSYEKNEMIPYDILKNAFMNHIELKERFQNHLEDSTLDKIKSYNNGRVEHNPAIFSYKDLNNMDFSESDLPSGVFIHANLKYADFDESNLMNACFRNAELRGASFMNCNLAHADFTNCDLRNAVFTGADLSNAKLTNARLEGADLTGANLEKAEIAQTLLAKIPLEKMKKEQESKLKEPIKEGQQKDKGIEL